MVDGLRACVVVRSCGCVCDYLVVCLFGCKGVCVCVRPRVSACVFADLCMYGCAFGVCVSGVCVCDVCPVRRRVMNVQYVCINAPGVCPVCAAA